MTLRILLADDHRILREGIRRSFESAGEEVVAEASNGEEALTLALETRPDVIVMDLSMPVLDGVTATRRICQELPGARVVVLTMHDDVATTQRALDAGAVGFLTKGSSFVDVLRTVRAAVERETGLTPELAGAMLATAARAAGQSVEELVESASTSGSGSGSGSGVAVPLPGTEDVAVDEELPDSGPAEDDAGPILSERQIEILQSIANGATTKQVARQLGITQKTVHNHLNAIYRRLDTQSLTHAVLSAVRLGIIDIDLR